MYKRGNILMQQSGSILLPWAIDYASGAPEVAPFARHTVHVPVSYALEGRVRYSDTKKCTCMLCSCTTPHAMHPVSQPPARLWWTVRLRHGAPDAFQSLHRGERVPLILGDTRFPFPFSVPPRGRGGGLGGARLETHADERYVMSLEGKSNNLWPRLKSD